MSIENAILYRVTAGIRNRLGLGAEECYPCLDAAYIDGQSERVIQVIPGEISEADDVPEGGQVGGGYIIKTQIIRLVLWIRLKLDGHQLSEHLLQENTIGFLEWSKQIRDLFGFTTLGETDGDGFLMRQMYWKGETGVSWYDEDGGVGSKTMTFSVTYAEKLPENAKTLSESDVEQVIIPEN